MEVQSRGAPAQASRAQDLISALRADPTSASTIEEALSLIEAYLHDPYLVKIEPTEQSER